MIKLFLCLYVLALTFPQTDTLFFRSVKLVPEVNEFEYAFIKEIVYLYNRKTGNRYTIDYFLHSSFGDLFKEMRGKNYERDHYLVASQLSRNKERMTEFEISYPYMKSGKVISSLRSKTLDFTKKQRLGFFAKTNDELFVKTYQDKHPTITPVPFNSISSQVNALQKGDIELLIVPVSISWSYDLNVLETFLDSDFNSIAVYYKKNSNLKKAFDPIIKYFVKSPKFYTLIRKHFGINAVNHYKSFTSH